MDDTDNALRDLTTPHQAARNYLATALVSLQESAQSYAVKTCSEFLKLKHHQFQLNHTVKLLQDDDYIPRSARVAFQLRKSKRVEGSDAFKTLETATNDLVRQFQSDLKEKIQQSTDLEVTTIRNEINKLFCVEAKTIS